MGNYEETEYDFNCKLLRKLVNLASRQWISTWGAAALLGCTIRSWFPQAWRSRASQRGGGGEPHSPSQEHESLPWPRLGHPRRVSTQRAGGDTHLRESAGDPALRSPTDWGVTAGGYEPIMGEEHLGVALNFLWHLMVRTKQKKEAAGGARSQAAPG